MSLRARTIQKLIHILMTRIDTIHQINCTFSRGTLQAKQCAVSALNLGLRSASMASVVSAYITLT